MNAPEINLTATNNNDDVLSRIADALERIAPPARHAPDFDRAVDEPIAVSGHRFRLEGSVRDALITSLLPTDLFIRPSAGGVVIWPNWYAAAPGTLPIRIDLRRPS